MNGIRYANIGAAVGIAIIGLGVFLFRDSSDDVIQVIGLIGFLVGGAVYVILDERATRRKEDRPQ